jgi:CheY-like chemotaxis protein
MENTSSTALVVDDNYFNRDLFKLALEHVGYVVLEAENGLIALNMLKESNFDLLVVDLAMPELDGASLIRKIREGEGHERMIIVVVTANHHLATNEVDADYVMYKPINIAEFAPFTQRLMNYKNNQVK